MLEKLSQEQKSLILLNYISITQPTVDLINKDI